MPIVYDDASPAAAPDPAATPSGTIVYDTPPPPVSPSQDVWQRGAPPLTLSGLVAGQPVPDKYQQAAIAERDRLLQAGAPLPEGYTRRLMSGPALGWGDEISAAAMTPLEMLKRGVNPAEGYRYAKAREDLAEQAARQKTGLLGDVAETAGAMAFLPGNVFGRQAAEALGGAGKGILPAVARMTGYGLESGALGAVQGAGQARTTQDMAHDAIVGGALSGAFGAPFGALADVARRTTAVVPTEADLFNLGKRDYRARDAIPIGYDSQYVADKLDNLRQGVQTKYAYDAPRTVTSLDNFANAAHNNVARANAANPNYVPGSVVPSGQISGAQNPWVAVHTPRQIASIRRNIYNEAAAGSPTDERAGTIAAKAFDRILTRPDPAALAPGSTMADAALAASLDSRARGNFGAAYRSKAITDQVAKTIDDAATAGSGLNFENRLRQNINAAKKRDEFGNFNAAEQAGVEKLITATARANNIRELGNMLGGGGGLGRMVAMGGGFGTGGALTAYMTGNDPVWGGIAGLAAGMTGRGLRSYGNAKALSTAEAFAEDLRRRSPEYATRAAAAPMAPGPGLPSPAGALRTAATLGGGGGVRDAVAAAILKASGLQSPEDL